MKNITGFYPRNMEF